MDTSIPTGIRIVGIHEDTRRARVSFLFKETETDIILSVLMGTH